MADQHGSGRTRHAVHVVVLGEPEAAVTPKFSVLGQIERVAQSVGGAAAFDDGGEVKDGQGDHGGIMPASADRRGSGAISVESPVPSHVRAQFK